MSEKPSIFISYSRENEDALKCVVEHLGVLERYSPFEFWHDSKMVGGDTWRKEIDHQLRRCVVAVILVSTNSLNSEFILGEEVKVMLERRSSEGLRIYPIVVRSCYWQAHPWLEELNLKLRNGKGLMELAKTKRDPFMTGIVAEIADILAQKGLVNEPDSIFPDQDQANTLAYGRKSEGETAPGFQGWGTPFDKEDLKITPSENDDIGDTVPAPSPPALISIPEIPTWSDDLGIPVPDSFLLKPESRVVPCFASDMDWREAIFGWAKEQERPLKLRLQAGAGGTGKTRLALDVCETLAEEGWFAGFLPAGLDGNDVERDLPALLEADRDCLFVIDYAETRADVVVTLARQLLIAVERRVKAAASRRRFRIVMLAREGGDWFNQLAERATRARDEALKALLTPGATNSGPHRMSPRPPMELFD